MRGVDTAARYGGEEIALILPRTDMLNAYNVGERIRTAISEIRVTTDSEPPKVLGVTASLGIAGYPETKVSKGEDLVRRADRALYRAKKTGKNRVELFWNDDTGPARHPTNPLPIIEPQPKQEWPIERIDRDARDRSKPFAKTTVRMDRSKSFEKVEPEPVEAPRRDTPPPTAFEVPRLPKDNRDERPTVPSKPIVAPERPTVPERSTAFAKVDGGGRAEREADVDEPAPPRRERPGTVPERPIAKSRPFEKVEPDPAEPITEPAIGKPTRRIRPPEVEK
jgi:hypothetical protein